MNRNVKWQFVPIGSKCKRLNLIGIILRLIKRVEQSFNEFSVVARKLSIMAALNQIDRPIFIVSVQLWQSH